MRNELQTIAQNLAPLRVTSNPNWRPTVKLSKSVAKEAGDFDSYRLTYDVLDRGQRKAVREWLVKYGLAIQWMDLEGSRWNQFRVLHLWPAEHVARPERCMHILRYPGEE
jgi:hypothetical protein